MRNVLITGATGYLASALLRLLSSRDVHLTRLARTGSRLTPVPGGTVADLTGSVTDPSIWNSITTETDTIFHLAGQTSAAISNQDPAADFEINVLPVVQLLENCRRRDWQPAVVLASTVTISGIPTRLPVSESHPDNPLTVYDLHKLMAENYLKYYARQGVVSGTVIRLANVYGPGPRSSSADRGILNRIIMKALNGEDLTIYGSGDQIRDYVYVDDVARAFAAAAENMAHTCGRHFVIGSGRGCSISQAVRLVSDRVKSKTGRQVAVDHIPPPGPQLEIESRNFVADISAFRQATAWTPDVDLPEGIDRTIEYWSGQ